MNDKARLERALQETADRLAADPASLDLKARRARLLATLSRTDEAKAVYLELLAQDPDHFAALNDFGALLNAGGYRTAARTLFGRAVARHPLNPLGHANLADLRMADGELAAARTSYETALRLDPTSLPIRRRLDALLRELGEIDEAPHCPRQSADGVQAFPYLGDGEARRLLVLTSTPGGDIAWPALIDDRTFAATALAPALFDPEAPLPPHDLIFNAIGDADLCAEDLEAAARLVQRSPAPVVNLPAKVALTGRIANAERLGRLPGVVAPRMARLDRKALETDGLAALRNAGLDFPVLLRSPGFHMGRHFIRVTDVTELASMTAALPGAVLTAIQPLDAAGADGYVRKYRVVLIAGRLHPLHMAASRGWKVHYVTSAMADDAGLRTEEAAFLSDMPAALGPKAVRALEAVAEALGLDYAGVDFGLGRDGELLLFEANATMSLAPPDADPKWDYRRGAVLRAFAAARAMIADKIGAGTARIG